MTSWGCLRGPLPKGQDPPSFAETVILPRERFVGSRLFAGDPTLLYPFTCVYICLLNIIYLSSTVFVFIPFDQLHPDGPTLERRPEFIVSPMVDLHVHPAGFDLRPPLESLRQNGRQTRRAATLSATSGEKKWLLTSPSPQGKLPPERIVLSKLSNRANLLIAGDRFEMYTWRR